MSFSSYSFSDILLTFNHPSTGLYTLNGQGIGEVNIEYTDDNTIHDRAADGVVMVSRVTANNAQLSITMQQTSTLHTYLKNYFNVLKVSPSSLWASATITINSVVMPDNIEAIGVSPAKRAGQPYQQQGQMVTWNFMSAEVDQV